ncbi:related to JSN1-RNA-binding protein (pumilio family) [Ustilago bromivora]|uniref:Related to JSN1 - RNA-binding protein (Pumilio family) n=1 Tax=Ustilago bromivora TaxID=307758 RepID=A0A1K0FXN7_9BASI|nr:related to JSN1-RNA-binding protein (pumilio family) [Ustilago bromivora]SYW85288.1 related to JSN1 - RNA-binding protein (pumilio family) [Ustilago bromivora]
MHDHRYGDGASTSQSPIMSKRALQLQAEEAFMSQPPYRTASIANESDPIVQSTHPSRSARGRARAGTLPSSWGDSLPGFQPPAIQHRQSPFPHIHSSHALRAQAPPLTDLARVNSASQLPASNQQSQLGTGLAPPASSNRLRSGSLTLPTANLANPFGPSFFSSNWQPTRSGLSNVTSVAAEDESQYRSTDQYNNDGGPRFSLVNADMLQYLGLSGSSPHSPNSNTNPSSETTTESDFSYTDADAYLASAQLRNRSSTLAGQHLRPRLNNGEGRARSSSYLPSFAFSTAEPTAETSPRPPHGSSLNRSGNLSGSQSPYSGNAPHSSLLNTALHNRLHHYNPASSQYAADMNNDRSPINASRPRATSMGVLDQPNPRTPLNRQQPSGLPNNPSAPHSAFGSSLTSPGSAGNLNLIVPLGSLASHLDTQNDLSAFLVNGRNRAGTIAAFSGPGGRARAEQELLRMTQIQYEAVMARDPQAQTRPSSSGLVESLPSLDIYSSARSQQQKGSTRSGTSSPFAQPTRSLWIGHLRPDATSQDLLQSFSHYGPIETFRMVPEKACAFINYVDIVDAVRARDDIIGRLACRLGFGTIGPEGQVRVGFGKPDSMPQSGMGSFAPMTDSFGGAVDVAGTEVFGAEPANQEPSRALWIGSVPSTTCTEALMSIFSSFGPIESIRVLASKSCAFINFRRLDDAIIARKALNGRELLGTELGPVKIGFAKVQTRIPESYLGSLDPGSPEFQAAMETLASMQASGDGHVSQGAEKYRSTLGPDQLSRQHLQVGSQALAPNLSREPSRAPASATTLSSGRVGSFPTHSSSNSIVPSSDKGGVPLPAEMKPRATVSDLQHLLRQLDDDDPNLESDLARIAQPRPQITYLTRIPPVPEPPPCKRFDNNRLKEIRKRLEQPSSTSADADAIARDYLPSIVDLSSDLIGNTLVQKFFERCSEAMKRQMLQLIAPHLATIGVHKNGTWAAQKIIDCTYSDDQKALIVQEIKAYVPPLLLDQFGNYVVQRLIPFGEPHVAVVWEAMVDRCWEIAQGRFGARSMRTCLELPEVSKFHIKQVALAIVLNSVPLATSQNGALLVTWLLDAIALKGRYTLLAPRFAPHLANLCTHKLASQTVLRVIAQKEDVQASRQLLTQLFQRGDGGGRLLEEILLDQVHGSQFVTKLFVQQGVLQEHERVTFAEQVTGLLVKHGLVGLPPYRPLAVQMGLLIQTSGNSYGYQNGTAAGDALVAQLGMLNLSSGVSTSGIAGRVTSSGFGALSTDSTAFDPWAQSQEQVFATLQQYAQPSIRQHHNQQQQQQQHSRVFY